MRRLTLGFVALAAILVPAACSTEQAPTPPERTGSLPMGIVNGSPDTTHDAVVALAYVDGQTPVPFCTGTIISVNGSTGYVLTAAHCVSGGAFPDIIMMGDDFLVDFSYFNVVDYAPHPNYNGNPGAGWDIGMVTFTGANAGTPVIPAMTEATDNLQDGSSLEFVGYGLDYDGNPDNDYQRKHVTDTADDVTTFTIEYDQQPGGPCSGDSGGPSLTSGMVSGVTSYGDQQCEVTGTSMRVSAAYDNFIGPWITGNPPVLDCNDCQSQAFSGNGECVDEGQSCVNDAQCEGLLDCFDGCNTDACYQDCADQFPGGVPLYNAIVDCICLDACATECANVCGGSSSSSSTTGSGPATSSAATTGAGGAGGAGGGGETGAGAGDPATTGAGETVGAGDAGVGGGGDEPKANDPGSSGSCAVGPTPAGGRGGVAFGLAALLGLLAARRRRAAQ